MPFRINISNFHKEITGDCYELAYKLRNYTHPETKRSAPLLKQEAFDIYEKHRMRIQETIKYENDFEYDFFAFKTLERSYLLKMNGKVSERPQQLLFRVAISTNIGDIDSACKVYEMLAEKAFTPATPTLFNSGMEKGQSASCLSCLLMDMKEDSIVGIYDTLKNCSSIISKHAGGIDINRSDIRATWV